MSSHTGVAFYVFNSLAVVGLFILLAAVLRFQQSHKKKALREEIADKMMELSSLSDMAEKREGAREGLLEDWESTNELNRPGHVNALDSIRSYVAEDSAAEGHDF